VLADGLIGIAARTTESVNTRGFLIVWTIAIVAAFAPLAIARYRRRV
jgi:hypothetical protein